MWHCSPHVLHSRTFSFITCWHGLQIRHAGDKQHHLSFSETSAVETSRDDASSSSSRASEVDFFCFPSVCLHNIPLSMHAAGRGCLIRNWYTYLNQTAHYSSVMMCKYTWPDRGPGRTRNASAHTRARMCIISLLTSFLVVCWSSFWLSHAILCSHKKGRSL